MGVFSKYHRFREAGEEANVNNVERYGKPVFSLFTTTKVFSLHHHIEITDAQGKMIYEANTKFPSIHDKTDITDAEGRHVAHMERKLLTLHESSETSWDVNVDAEDIIYLLLELSRMGRLAEYTDFARL